MRIVGGRSSSRLCRAIEGQEHPIPCADLKKSRMALRYNLRIYHLRTKDKSKNIFDLRRLTLSFLNITVLRTNRTI